MVSRSDTAAATAAVATSLLIGTVIGLIPGRGGGSPVLAKTPGEAPRRADGYQQRRGHDGYLQAAERIRAGRRTAGKHRLVGVDGLGQVGLQPGEAGRRALLAA